VSEPGQIRYQLKTAYRDGTTHIVLEPLDLMSRLAALVPPPRMHLTQFHGGKLKVIASIEEPQVIAEIWRTCRTTTGSRLGGVRAGIAGRPEARPIRQGAAI